MSKSAAILLAFSFVPFAGFSQVTPDMARGITPYAEYIPSGIDNVNPVNGNIFLKIPLVGFPQRGGKLRLDYYIYYNDKQWSVTQTPPPNPVPNVNQYDGGWALGMPTETFQTGLPYSVGAYVARDQFLQGSQDFNYYSYTYQPTQYQAFTITTTVTDNYWITPDGGRHYVGDWWSQTCNANGGGTCPSEPNPNYVTEAYPATDATGYDQYGHGPDGITYSGAAVTDPNGNSITFSATGWTDTFGRQIPGSQAGPGSFPFPNSPGNPPQEAGDPVPGIPSSSVPSECPAGTREARIWTVPGSQSYENGEVTYYLCYTYYNYSTAFNLSSVLPSSYFVYDVSEASSSSPDGQALMLTAIVLPDTNSYKFQYDQYLSLTELTLPTGATITYTWQNVVFAPWSLSSSAPISRALKTRTINPGNGQPPITFAYHWYISSTAPTSATSGGVVTYPAYGVVTDSNGNDEEYTLGGTDDGGRTWNNLVNIGEASYSGCSPHDTASDATCSPKPGTRLSSVTYALTEYYSGGAAEGTASFMPPFPNLPPTIATQTTTHLATAQGDILSRTVKNLVPNYGTCSVWIYPIAGPGEEAGIATSGGGPSPPPVMSGPVSNCYSTGQIASVSTYDFGSPGSGLVGALLKTETPSYQWQSQSAYLTANLLNLLSGSVTTNGSGGWAAQTAFAYDQSPSPSGPHGNQTSIGRYITPTTMATSQTHFNSNGVATLAIDPNGNQTSYNNFACNGSLPQTVIDAYGSTTTIPETTSLAYDCNTGKTISSQDPNLKTTTYTYTDPLNRVTAIAYPDGGSVSVNYNNDALPLTMTITKQTGETAGPMVVTAQYDGLAREITSQTTTSSSGPSINSFTNYDDMGRVYDVSNPYYSTNDPTYGVTLTSYDALSRPARITNSDGSSVQFCYNGIASAGQTNCNSYLASPFSGSWVDSTDELGNDRQRTSDSLGRLRGVTEPNGIGPLPAMETDYTYNALGDLLTVVQAGAPGVDTPRPTRTFTYDGLSRLLSAFNPENGIASYAYDPIGNLVSKTSPLVNATSGTQTISYYYDALNRLLSKINSDGSTPSSCYQYDGSSVLNGIGRMAASWTQTASGPPCPSTAPTSPNAFWTMRSILAYDPMGRIWNEQQFAPSNITNGASTSPCQHGTVYGIAYCYDLAGNLTSSTSGVGPAPASPPIIFTNSFDSAGRLQTTMSSYTNNGAFPALIFSAPTSQSIPCTNSSSGQYTPSGALMNATYGNGLTLNRAFDSRLRMTCEIDTGSLVVNPTSGSATVPITGAEQVQ